MNEDPIELIVRAHSGIEDPEDAIMNIRDALAEMDARLMFDENGFVVSMDEDHTEFKITIGDPQFEPAVVALLDTRGFRVVRRFGGD